MSRCPDIDEQMSQKSDEQMSNEQVLHNRHNCGDEDSTKQGAFGLAHSPTTHIYCIFA